MTAIEQDHDRNEFYRRHLRETGTVCNCGGPQYGTGHSPDCALELAWDFAMSIYEDESAS